MKLLGRLAIAAAVWLAGISATLAQTTFPTPGGSNAPGAIMMCPSAANALLKVPCDVTNPLAVNASVSATITFPTFGAAFPATGIASGMSQGGNLTAMTGTAGNLNVNCQVGCSGGSFNNNADNVATSATNGQVAAWGYVWDGAAWDRLYGDATNGAFVNVKTSVLPTGASTSALQTTGNTALTTINTTLGAGIPTAVNVTPTNCSGTITTGGTAQNAFAAGATKHGFMVMNLSTEDMWVSFTTTAAPATVASYLLNPSAASVAGGSFSSPVGFGINTALSVVGATTGNKFSCTFW